MESTDPKNMFNSILKDPEPLPLDVPEHLEKPADAEVAADGTVACIGCRRRLPVAEADIAGMGYRCTRCSQQASIQVLSGGRSDIRAHLDERDRQKMYRDGAVMLALGIVVMIGGTGLAFTGVLEEPRNDLTLAVGGIGLASFGVMRIRAAR